MAEEHQFTPEELAYYRAIFLSPTPELSPASLARWTEVQIALTAGEPADVEEAWEATGPAHFRVPMVVFGVATAVVPFIPYLTAVLMPDGHLLASEQTHDLLECGLGFQTMRHWQESGPGVYTVDEDAHVASIVEAMEWRAQYPLYLDADDIPHPPPTIAYDDPADQRRPSTRGAPLGSDEDFILSPRKRPAPTKKKTVSQAKLRTKKPKQR